MRGDYNKYPVATHKNGKNRKEEGGGEVGGYFLLELIWPCD